MKDLLTVVFVAVAGALVFQASSSHALCFGQQPKITDNSTCSNVTDIRTGLCQMRCLLCSFSQVAPPFGCLNENDSSCQCIGRPAGEGGGSNATTTSRPSLNGTTSAIPINGTSISTFLPNNGTSTPSPAANATTVAPAGSTGTDSTGVSRGMLFG